MNDITVQYRQLKNKIRNAVIEGTRFIFNCMDGGKVPSYNHETTEYGLWPSAEMCQFLLTDNILPKTCGGKIKEIMKHLTDNFHVIDDEKRTGAWYATINNTDPYYSTQTTGYCLRVLRQYSNEFLSDEEKKNISFIIECAENYIIGEQQKAGYWIPRNDSTTNSRANGFDQAEFFYSFYSYMGIATMNAETSNIKSTALANAKQYFSQYAEWIIGERGKGEYDELIRKPDLLSIISKLIQVLNDFIDDRIAQIILELEHIAVEVFDDVNKLLFCTTTVTLPTLPPSVQNTFHNNTPFDTYWAMREEKFASKKLLELVNVFLSNQDSTLKCWYLDFNKEKKQNTWTTIEALMVLSDAYNLLSEEFYLRELRGAENQEKKCSSCKLEMEEKCKQCKSQHELELKRNKNSLMMSRIIAVLISLSSIVIFIIIIATQPLTQGMQIAVEIFFVPLGLSILLEVAKWLWTIVNKRNNLKSKQDKKND